MHLSPESLEAFVQAVSLGSFSAAARKLGKSQSTVSEAIARLEIDLGLELFDRSGRQPQLTEAGRTLLGRVEEVLGASDRLRRVAALLAGGSEPRVTLALSDTYHSARYEARLAELDERYPELEFECLIAEDQDVIAQVSRGRATLGLLAAQPHYPPELGVAAVAERAEFGLFAAVDHPLAGLERVSERDLSEWRLLRLNTYSETGAAINDGLPSSGGRCWSAPNYLLLEGEFLGAGRATEDRIAMGKAPEAADDLAMLTSVGEEGLAESVVQRYRAILVGKVLGMGERQVEEQPQRVPDLAVEALSQSPLRPAPRLGVAGVHARGSTEGVARVLVEQQQQAEMVLGFIGSRAQRVGAGKLVEVGEALAEAPVEIGVPGEPEGRAGIAPETDHFRQRGRAGRKQKRCMGHLRIQEVE